MTNHRPAVVGLVPILLLAGCVERPPTGPPPPLQAVHALALREVRFEPTPERVERGRYLANSAVGCVLCHSERERRVPGAPPVAGREFDGAVITEEPGYRLVVPNLTPDPETGAGAWSDDMLARAIREGVGHGGRGLGGEMWWWSFRNLSDEDLASIVVYLRPLPAVRNALPPRLLSPAQEQERAERARPLEAPVPTPNLADPVARGTISQALSATGFTVTVLEDATLIGMRRAIRVFGVELLKASVGIFYYAGQGMQVKGANFLIPVNADIEREDEIADQAIDANFVLSKMDSAKNALNIMILVACRNNPFARSFRSAARGLAQMDAPSGTLISFATAPGSVASDGAGQNGLFTEHLLKAIQQPGLPIEQVFKQVRIGVTKATNDQQIPWESSSLKGDFFFMPPDPAAEPVYTPTRMRN